VPFIHQTLSLPPEELEKLSKSDRNFTFLHNIARFTRDPKVIRDQMYVGNFVSRRLSFHG
jgi:hypothetical protein